MINKNEPPSYTETTTHNPIQEPSIEYITPPTYLNCIDGNGHFLVTEPTLGGILLAILLFPCGLLCCLFMSQQRCMKCGRLYY